MLTTRLIFFTLLLANVLFFAWRQNAGPAEGHEPQRLQQQIEADKLKLIAPEAAVRRVPSSKPAETEAGSAGLAAPLAANSSAQPAAAQPLDLDAPLLCKAFTGLSPESAKAAQAAISNSAPNTKVALITTKESNSYWVHIPAQPNKAGAEKKVTELKELGVQDSFIISDEGPNRWAVSLGLFRSRDMADNYLQKLSKQGVRSARLETRDKGTDKMRLEISAPADVLGVLAREIKPLANATLGDCKPLETAKN